MTKAIILEMMESWENLALFRHDSPDHGNYFPVLMEIALEGNLPVNWRASWIADKISEKNPGIIAPWTEAIIKALPGTNHSGKKRQLLRMIVLNEIPVQQEGFLFDYCMERLMASGESIAVRAYSMQILYNISEKEKELKGELLQLLEQVMDQSREAGILARGQKLIIRLRKEISNQSSIWVKPYQGKASEHQ